MFREGQIVHINHPGTDYHGQTGTIMIVSHRTPFEYLVRMPQCPDEFGETDFWFNADEFAESQPKRVGSPSEQAGPAPESPQDFDRGFGIGGLSRHAETEGLARLIANGTLRYREPTGNKMPHGQLWEPCHRWGCDEEPVCLDCGYCERHCSC